MHKNQSMVDSPLSDQIDSLLAQFGGRSTLLAVFAGLRRRRKLLNDTQGMSERMREDAGLPSARRSRSDLLFADVSAYRILR